MPHMFDICITNVEVVQLFNAGILIEKLHKCHIFVCIFQIFVNHILYLQKPYLMHKFHDFFETS